ncbi:integrase, catalytic region, zinc finger, CCHC-type containing protein [Tanacetum coccineum]
MTILAERMIVAGANNRPHMLEKSIYDFWQSCMLIYIQGKEHGRIILNSVKEGLLDWGTIEADGVTRPKTYEELSEKEKLQADCDLKATNIVLQDLPPDVHSLVNHHNGEGHMARQCTQPKRPRNSAWFKEKMLLVQALESGQTDDLDAYDSDCDDISLAKAVLMASLSSYDSNVLSKVTKCTEATKETQIVNETLTAELERFKERVKKIEERQNVDLNSREKCSVDKKYFDIQKKEFFLDNDRLLEHIICQDVMNIVMHDDFVSEIVLRANNKCLVNDNLEVERLIQENDHLFELLLSQDIVHICVNSLAKLTNYGKMEQDYINEYNETLVLKAELSKTKHMEFLEINDLQAKLKVKDVAIANLKKHIAYLKAKSVLNESISTPNVIAPRMFKLDLEPLSPKLLKNRDAHIDYIKHTLEHADILREIVKHARVLKPLDSDLDSAFTLLNKNKKVKFAEPTSSSRMKSSTSTSRSQPLGNTKKNRISFGNDQITKIMGYGDYQMGNVMISWVYYVEGLGYNLFFVGQFYDSGLKVAFRKHTGYICDLEGVDLLKGSRGSNLYTLSLEDMMLSSPIFLLSKALKTKSWLWHRRLSHLNFDYITTLAKQDMVSGSTVIELKHVIVLGSFIARVRADYEGYTEERMTGIMTELILRECMEKAQDSSLAKPNIDINAKIKLSKEHLKELRNNACSGSEEEDVIDHIAKVLEILDSIKTPNMDTDRLCMHVKGGGNNKLMDDIISSNEEWEESNYGNPPNTDTDSFFKSYLDAQEKCDICLIEKRASPKEP